MPRPWFYLTKSQIEAIDPLIQMVLKANENGDHRCAIVMQPTHNDSGEIGMCGYFYPEKYAARINKIIKECSAELKKQREDDHSSQTKTD